MFRVVCPNEIRARGVYYFTCHYVWDAEVLIYILLLFGKYQATKFLVIFYEGLKS